MRVDAKKGLWVLNRYDALSGRAWAAILSVPGVLNRIKIDAIEVLKGGE